MAIVLLHVLLLRRESLDETMDFRRVPMFVLLKAWIQSNRLNYQYFQMISGLDSYNKEVFIITMHDSIRSLAAVANKQEGVLPMHTVGSLPRKTAAV